MSILPAGTQVLHRREPEPDLVCDPALPVDVIVGVDTHADSHTAAFCDGRGGLLAVLSVATDADSMGGLLDVVEQLVADLDTPRVIFAVEGSGSYGAGLARQVRAWGFDALEIRKAGRPAGAGKNDTIDAVQIARTGLTQMTSPDQAKRRAQPRRGHVRDGLRALTCTRDKHVAHRTAHTNAFRALVITGPTQVRQDLRGLTQAEQRALVTRKRPRPVLPAAGTEMTPAQAHTFAVAQTYTVLATIAATIAHLDATIATLDRAIDRITARYAAPLRAELGVGPIVAATLLVAYSHHRFRSEAAFANLAGVAPLQASSGRTHRHRLNRNGDRQLNAALHRVMLTRRQRAHPATRAYIDRRATTDHLNDQEINRCLKRAIARHLYRILHALPELP